MTFEGARAMRALAIAQDRRMTHPTVRAAIAPVEFSRNTRAARDTAPDALERRGCTLGASGSGSGEAASASRSISRVYRGFWDELGPQQAAGELFVEPSALADEAINLSGVLPALADPFTLIPRTGFATGYIDALCRLHVASENRPSGCP